MKKTLGLVAAVIGLGTVGCGEVKETASKMDPSCNIVDIANIELTKYDYEGHPRWDSRWTAELKNADGEVVGGIDGFYIWFLCEDGRKFKMRNYLENRIVREPFYE